MLEIILAAIAALGTIFGLGTLAKKQRQQIKQLETEARAINEARNQEAREMREIHRKLHDPDERERMRERYVREARSSPDE